MTGRAWIEESGLLEGPVMLTNTHSVGTVHQATIDWRIRHGNPDSSGYWWSTPVVAETWDGELNDINGFHVKPEHVFAALDGAAGGPVAEGNVGGGTGMICHNFKCGIGTSSRRVDLDGHGYTVGALVQANYGTRSALRIAGHPGRPGTPEHGEARRSGQRLDHHRGRDRRAAPADRARSHREARRHGARPHGLLCGQRLGRHLRRVLDCQRESDGQHENPHCGIPG
jgi:L-aminopeptidase/D-esterase-like protein